MALPRFGFFLLGFCLLAFLHLSALRAEESARYIPLQTSVSNMEVIHAGTVTEILKPDQVRLDDGKVYTLDGLRVPPRRNGNAMGYLQQKLLNKKVGLYINPTLKDGKTDRYGNTFVHVMLEDGSWVQGDMVSRGLAWAYSTPTNRDLIEPLYKLEAAARQQGAGFWSDPEYAVKDAQTIEKTYGSFQIFEGKIRGVRTKDGFAYLNFGADPTKDFTITLQRQVFPEFTGTTDNEVFYPNELTNRKIRIRGWVESVSGPMISLTHREQIEFLDMPLAKK